MSQKDVAILYAPRGDWPGPATAQRRKPPFSDKTTVANSLELLRYELHRLDAYDATLRVDVDATQISSNGRLLARPASPGIILQFEKPARAGVPAAPASMPFDLYWTWEANVRAAALTLEALRAVERFGGAQRGEQYRGFLALPGSGGVNTTALQLTPERAARIVADAHPSSGARTVADRELMAHAIRTGNPESSLRFADEAWHAAHPDRGGSSALFTTITEARRVLYRHHGRDG